MSLGDRAFVLLQRLLPLHLVSAAMLWLSRLEWPPAAQLLIGLFGRLYAVDLSEAERDRAADYRSLNDYFTRALRPGARRLDPDAASLVAPCDGTVSEAGRLDGDRLLQATVDAKRHTYTLEALFADAGRARPFIGGSFACIYLAPHDYHRVHAPADCTLSEAWYVPGALYSVNAATARAIPGLYALNERVVLHFTSPGGPLALVLVGALNVGSISLADLGDCPPSRGRPGAPERLPARRRRYVRGEEVGRFNLGSTVIVVTGPGAVRLAPSLGAGARVRLGGRLGQWLDTGGGSAP